MAIFEHEVKIIPGKTFLSGDQPYPLRYMLQDDLTVNLPLVGFTQCQDRKRVNVKRTLERAQVEILSDYTLFDQFNFTGLLDTCTLLSQAIIYDAVSTSSDKLFSRIQDKVLAAPRSKSKQQTVEKFKADMECFCAPYKGIGFLRENQARLGIDQFTGARTSSPSREV